MQIDEFSQTLGMLQNQNAVIMDGIKDIRAHLEKLNGKTDKAHKRIDDLDEEVVTKKGIYRAVAVISAASGLTVAGVWNFISSYIHGP